VSLRLRRNREPLLRLLPELLDIGAHAGRELLFRLKIQLIERERLLRPSGVKVGVTDVEQEPGHRLGLIGRLQLAHNAGKVPGGVTGLRFLVVDGKRLGVRRPCEHRPAQREQHSRHGAPFAPRGGSFSRA
jgi:hypothetical protein